MLRLYTAPPSPRRSMLRLYTAPPSPQDATDFG
jgi:hypothetical protein